MKRADLIAGFGYKPRTRDIESDVVFDLDEAAVVNEPPARAVQNDAPLHRCRPARCNAARPVEVDCISAAWIRASSIGDVLFCIQHWIIDGFALVRAPESVKGYIGYVHVGRMH